MFLMAIGIVAALGTFSSLSKSGAKTLGLVMAIIIFLIFLVITFFKVSELNLLGFIAKKIRDVFLDTPKKFQINHKKNNPTDILIAKSHSQEGKQKIELKTTLDRSKISQLDKKGLL